MIDVRLLRTDLDGVKVALARKGVDVADIDRAAGLDVQLRSLEAARRPAGARQGDVEGRRSGEEGG